MISRRQPELAEFFREPLGNDGVHFILSKHAMLTTASSPDTGTMPSSQPSAATSSSETPAR